MRHSNFLRATILAATIAALGMSAQAGPMPTHTATAVKSMVQKNTTDARWGAGYYGRHGGYYDDYPAYGHRAVSYYDDIYCLDPLVVMPATRIQTRYLGVKPSERLPWTD